MENFVSRGMVVDFAVHQPDREDGGIPNPHFHGLCPIRPIKPVSYTHLDVYKRQANNSGIVNVADVGGLYNGQWIQAVSRWLTTVYTKTTVKLPKTGY